LPAPTLPCSVTVGGVDAPLQYCGSAPGATAGLLQVNARIPADAPIGSAIPVVITIGKSSSQSTVTLAVK
jgi:uncharacterized protein (TIGR03437 family)